MKRIVWTDQAKADVRALDKTTSFRLLQIYTFSPSPALGT